MWISLTPLRFYVHKAFSATVCTYKHIEVWKLKQMKTYLYSSLGLLSLSVILPLTPSFTPKADACAQTDVLTQVAIHGSQQPATQSGIFNMDNDGNCLGNSTTSTTTQVYAGEEAPVQTYEGNQFVGGGQFNNTGISSPVIENPIHIPVDVYSPAHDPNFLGY